MGEKKQLNAYDRLVDDLINDRLCLTLIKIAIKEYIRRREDIPKGVRNLLCGDNPSGSGYIERQFSIIQGIIGTMELAYRRGVQEGREGK